MLEQTKRVLLVSLNTAGLALALVMNALANALPLNGRNTGEISDSIPNLFVPAGITFSIWGLIYTLLIILIIYQIRTTAASADPNPPVDRLGIWFFISCLANAFWIITWHWQLLWASLVIMIILLASMIIMHTRIRREFFEHEIGLRFKFAVSLPISIYLGWITVATIANITALLVVLEWNRFGLSEEFWTVLMIGIATLVYLLGILVRRDIWFAAVGVWAFAGIYLKRTSLEVDPVESVIIAVIIGMVALSAGIIVGIILSAHKKSFQRT